ncbi:MAG: MBL fold metallo-hydrolase [Verrucomicrobia bacterium]|nr:MBL fold metallo-hydrolase [Verrucomicrobiota bacterium]MBU1736048.1 MBL fold metallo-hydrolase [Verrucomicrobiota bacterium]MBU1855832.1 MBL fold metallo-hydrolase [Verrucomicrobiota bacterium]
MKTGRELVRDVDECTLEEGDCALWWLGQQSFIVKLGSKVIYFDPFLSPHKKRRIPPLISPEDVTNADLILGSHDHTDHIDRRIWPTLAKSSPKAKFVVPELLLRSLARDLKFPIKRFVGLDDNRSLQVDGVKISAVAAAHEFLDRDPATGRYPYLGYIVEAHGVAVYHAGDTCIYEGLQTKLRRWRLDVAFLPINGRDAHRLAANCIGNMTYQEAADLAGALAPRLTIPAHFDMFPGNRCSPKLFIDYMRVKYPGLKTIVCKYGQRLIVKRR